MGNYSPLSPPAPVPPSPRQAGASHMQAQSHGSHCQGCLDSRLGRGLWSLLRPRGSPPCLGWLALCVGPFTLGEADEENCRNDRHQTHPEEAPPHQEVFVKLRQYEVGVHGLFLNKDLTVYPISLSVVWRCSSHALVFTTLQT